MIGKFIWHTPTGDHVVELHWVGGQPAWLTDNENLEYALNLIHGYALNHPDSPGYPYWWQALKGKKVTVLVEPPREVEPPPGGVF